MSKVPMTRKGAERFAYSITGITRSLSGPDPLGGRDAIDAARELIRCAAQTLPEEVPPQEARNGAMDGHRWFVVGLVVGILIAVLSCVLAGVALSAPARYASYASQRSSGAPLVVMPPAINAGAVDTAAVRYLSRYDDACLELTPWAQGVDGQPRADVPLMLRAHNPRIRLWLYTLVGDFWLPPSYVPQSWDHSAFRDVFDALNAGNGWLYDTAGGLWFPNYRVNLADSATVNRLGDVYVRALSLHLFDGIFLDDAHTSIAWTSKPARPLDVERAGFPTLAAMDSARLANVERLIARLKAAQPCLLVAVNGTGPMPAGADVRMQEGIGRLVTAREAIAQVKQGGTWWLKGECYSPAECQARLSMLRGVAVFAKGEAIISCGPDRANPPVGK